MEVIDFLGYILSGAAVGFMIGITGVGGGSLMTPWLMYTGIPLPVAVGTDLLYASITKVNAVASHHRAGNVHWNLALRLLLAVLLLVMGTGILASYLA